MITPLLIRLRLVDLSGRVRWQAILARLGYWLGVILFLGATFGLFGYLLGRSI